LLPSELPLACQQKPCTPKHETCRLAGFAINHRLPTYSLLQTAFFCQRLKKSSELDYTDLLATWWAVLNSLCAVLSGMKREETVARSRLMHRPESSFLLADCELQWSCSIISMFLGRNIEAAHGKLFW
jgi:hypothetical protein